MRIIHIGLDTEATLDDADAEALIARGLLYPCGVNERHHDLHLDPVHRFTLTDVEDLIRAIRRR